MVELLFKNYRNFVFILFVKNETHFRLYDVVECLAKVFMPLELSFIWSQTFIYCPSFRVDVNEQYNGEHVC